jgi:outer membrane protein
MNAQGMYVGGSMGFSTTSYDGSTQRTSISFVPEFGVSFNDHIGVGMEIGYSNEKDESNKDVKTVTSNSFRFAPYFRFTAFQLGKVGVFADGKFSYVTSTDKTEYTQVGKTNVEQTVNSIGLYVQPGIAYSLNNKFSLVAKFGNIMGYTSSKPDVEGAKATTRFQFMNLSNNIQFGFYYNF